MKKIFILSICILGLKTLMAQQKDSFRYNLMVKADCSTPEKVVAHICNSAESDEDRLESIFYWVTHYIAIDATSYNKNKVPEKKSPDEILKNRRGDAYDFAILIKSMCESTGIDCQIIEGYEKNDLYENGAHFYKPNHAWNIALVNRKWVILDAYNGSGDIVMDLNWLKKLLQKINKKKLYTSTKFTFKQIYKPTYFLENVEESKITKIPVDPIWQLTDTILPITVFEKGKDEIIFFNEKYSQVQAFNPKLSEINRLPENEQIIECADRTYAYNPRYTEMKAKKHLALANIAFEKLKDKTLDKDVAMDYKKTGDEESKICKEMLITEKKYINEEYNALQKVNQQKRTDVIRYKQKFTSINQKFIQISNQKINQYRKEIPSQQHEIHSIPNKPMPSWNTIVLHNKQKSEKILENLLDSTTHRLEKIEEITQQIQRHNYTLQQNRKLQYELVDTLGFYMKKSDSSFIQEAQARSRNQDSFDDSIQLIRSTLYHYKVGKVDSLQKIYFDRCNQIQDTFTATANLYKQILKWCELNSKDLQMLPSNQPVVEQQYNQSIQLYKDAREGYKQWIVSYLQWMQQSMQTIKSMKAVYENENKYFAYLIKTEDDRKDYVRKNLEKLAIIEKKRNDLNIQNLQEIRPRKRK